MKQNEADRIGRNLFAKLGLPIKVRLSDISGQFLLLEPEGVYINEAFVVNVQIGWRSLNMDFQLGKFAADLLRDMAQSSAEQKRLFIQGIEDLINEKASVKLIINEKDVHPVSFTEWPSDWKQFSFSAKRSPLEINTEDHALTEHLLQTWIERFFTCVIAICPLEELQENEEVLGYPEGAITKILVNRYERNLVNRALCIRYHGCICKVCNVPLESVYGNLAKDFIHIHHVTPVSAIGDNYHINPIKDLVPVCPNCHAMLHRSNPPMELSKLKEIINVQLNRES